MFVDTWPVKVDGFGCLPKLFWMTASLLDGILKVKSMKCAWMDSCIELLISFLSY
jgi:hypothetical protein